VRKEINKKDQIKSLENLVNQREQLKLEGDNRYKLLDMIIKIVKDRMRTK